MKRIIAYVISFVLICSQFIAVNAMTDIENTKYEKAARLLMALDIVDVDESAAEFGAEEGIARGEFVKMIVRTFGYNEVALSSGKKIYEDVDSESEIGKCIDVLYQKGFISPATNFNPDKNISFNEAIKIIASAMGAEEIAKNNGGYPNGYLKYADDLGLLKNVTQKAELTKADASIIIYNALKTEVLDLTYVLSEKTDNSKTLMYKVFGLKEAKGVVTGTDKTKLYSKNGAGTGNVEIENEIYITDSKEIYDYLGYEVDFYYTDDEGENKLKVFIPTSKNNVTVINSENIVNAENNRVIYYNHYERETAAKFDENADYILNGMNAALSEQSDLKIDNGRLNLIDNDGDGSADVIVSENYINYVVSAYSNGKIYSKYGMNVIDITKLTEDGFEFENDFSTVKEWTVLSVYTDKFTEENGIKMCDFENSEVIKFEISNTRVSGKVNGYEEDYISIDDIEYEYSGGMYDKVKDENFSYSEYTFYLDTNNKVAAFDKQAAGSIQAGILGGLYIDEQEEENSQLKVFDENGVWSRYTLADRITIDGEKGTREDMLARWSASGKISEQLILFKLNAEGKVTYIDTEYTGVNEDKEEALALGETFNRKYRTASCTFEGIGAVGSETKLFVVGGEREAYLIDSEAADKFRFYASAKSYLKDNTSYYAKLYNIDETYICDYVLVYVESNAKKTVSTGSKIGLFESITVGINDEDEAIYNVSYYDFSTGKLATDKSETEVMFYKTEDGKDVEITPKDFKKGDLIRIDTTTGVVGAVKLDARTDTDTPAYGNIIMAGAQAGYIQETRVAAGRVYSVRDSMYSIYYGNDIASLKTSDTPYKSLEAQRIGNINVIIFNRDSKTVEVGSTNDILGYISSGDEKTYSYIYQNYGTPIAMVIVR